MAFLSCPAEYVTNKAMRLNWEAATGLLVSWFVWFGWLACSVACLLVLFCFVVFCFVGLFVLFV